MSRADCDGCDQHLAKVEEDLRTYREASEAANRIIERQAKEIAQANSRIRCWKDIAENRAKIIKRQTKILNERDGQMEEQAHEIQKLRAELTGCSPNMAQFVATPLENKIIWHDIDLERSKEQIKSLQSALIKERFWAIWREGKHTDVKAATELAKKQLRAEPMS